MSYFKKITFIASTILLCNLSLPGTCQSANPLDGIVFDCTYVQKVDNKGEEEIRFLSNGKGLVRYVKVRGGNTDFVLYDLKNKTMTAVFVDTKKYTVLPFSLFPNQPLQMDEQSIEADSEFLGTEKIDGFECRKYNRVKGMTRGLYWIGDKTHFLVHCRIKAKEKLDGPETEMILKKCSLEQPDKNMFEIPSDCIRKELIKSQP